MRDGNIAGNPICQDIICHIMPIKIMASRVGRVLFLFIIHLYKAN
jgi:hypothetical protein